jgi:hypothetical protein
MQGYALHRDESAGIPSPPCGGTGDAGFRPAPGNFFTFEKVTKKKTGNCVSGTFLSVSEVLTFYRYCRVCRSYSKCVSVDFALRALACMICRTYKFASYQREARKQKQAPFDYARYAI